MRKTIFEVNMSPSFLSKKASAAGAKIGIEYEMMAPAPPLAISNDVLWEVPDRFNTLYNWFSEIRRAIQPYKTKLESLEQCLQNIRDVVGTMLRDDITYDEDEFVEYVTDVYLSRYQPFRLKVTQECLKPELSKHGIRLNDDQFETLAKIIANHKQPPDDLSEIHQTVVSNVTRRLLMVAEYMANDAYENYTTSELFRQVSEYIKTNVSNYDLDGYIDSQRLSIEEWLIEFGASDVANLIIDLSTSRDFSEAANDFTKQTGIPVSLSKQYHGGKGSSNYRFEPDSSIDEDYASAGLEIISPPLDLETTIRDFSTIQKWAIKYGCETNSSTGLHINVSVPNIDKLDYIKLILLVGDTHILSQFGREGNTYARHAVEYFSDKILGKQSTSELSQIKTMLVSKLHQAAKTLTDKVIEHDEKYVSVRFDKSGYIEFRSPGGDWLNRDSKEIFDVVARFITVMSIACDPAAYRNEYQKKFYMFVKHVLGNDVNNPLSELVASYAAGITNVNQFVSGAYKKVINAFIARLDRATRVHNMHPADSINYIFIGTKPGVSLVRQLTTYSVIGWSKYNVIDELRKEYPNLEFVRLTNQNVGSQLMNYVYGLLEKYSSSK